jgi:hypothetical protein
MWRRIGGCYFPPYEAPWGSVSVDIEMNRLNLEAINEGGSERM